MDDNANWKKGVYEFYTNACIMYFNSGVVDFEAARDEKNQNIKKIMFRNLPDSSTAMIKQPDGQWIQPDGRPTNLNGQWIPVERIATSRGITLKLSDPYVCSEHLIRSSSAPNAEFFAVDQNDQFINLDPASSRDSKKRYNPASSGDLSGVQFQSFGDIRGVTSGQFKPAGQPNRRTFNIGFTDDRKSDCFDLPSDPAPAWCKFKKKAATGNYILFQGLPEADGLSLVTGSDGEDDEPPNNIWLRVEFVDYTGTRLTNPCNSKDYSAWSLPAQGRYALVSENELPDDAQQVSPCL